MLPLAAARAQYLGLILAASFRFPALRHVDSFTQRNLLEPLEGSLCERHHRMCAETSLSPIPLPCFFRRCFSQRVTVVLGPCVPAIKHVIASPYEQMHSNRFSQNPGARMLLLEYADSKPILILPISRQCSHLFCWGVFQHMFENYIFIIFTFNYYCNSTEIVSCTFQPQEQTNYLERFYLTSLLGIEWLQPSCV